jgi:excisionase family DNA binding protein
MKSPSDKVLSLTEAGKIYNVQPETILKLAQAGKFKAYRVGKLWRIDRASLESYIASTATVQEVA